MHSLEAVQEFNLNSDFALTFFSDSVAGVGVAEIWYKFGTACAVVSVAMLHAAKVTKTQRDEQQTPTKSRQNIGQEWMQFIFCSLCFIHMFVLSLMYVQACFIFWQKVFAFCCCCCCWISLLLIFMKFETFWYLFIAQIGVPELCVEWERFTAALTLHQSHRTLHSYRSSISYFWDLTGERAVLYVLFGHIMPMCQQFKF